MNVAGSGGKPAPVRFHLVRYGIESAPAPGMAAAKPFDGKESAFPHAVFIHGLKGVFRATGVISTALREKRGNDFLVDSNAPDAYLSKYIIRYIHVKDLSIYPSLSRSPSAASFERMSINVS